MRDDPLIIALVRRAAAGEPDAWDEIVERYVPLVWSICVRYQLSRQDIDDVGQNVWLLLVEHIGRVREPAALPGWLATTTHRQCLRVVRAAHRRDRSALPQGDDLGADPDAPAIDEDILAAERDAAVRAAFAELPGPCRELLAMLISDPPYSYAQVSAALNIAVGSIGSKRGRCLKLMRQSPHLAAIIDDGSWDADEGQARGDEDG